jgi:hypothetical protein
MDVCIYIISILARARAGREKCFLQQSDFSRVEEGGNNTHVGVVY